MTSSTPEDVDVVLPCPNEAEALPWVLPRIPPRWRALVVDNGSTDGSADIARELGATVVHEPRRGFGSDLGPLRAACREPLLALGLTDRRSGYPLEMVVRAADAGWRVTEHDVPCLPRAGVSKVTGTWRGTWQAVRDMSRVPAEAPVVPAAAPAHAGGGR
ncbi:MULTISPECIES: glycosyltransferase [unclassified Streptomyces]|uniref:glycosyltransferase n=1 Tax=unclassified Streptomyces TaxID=2593676 RepID=UPI00336A3219